MMSEILKNSKALRDYHVLETVEAGIALRGTEVKSLRAGLGNIRDSFALIEKDQAFLHNAHIEEYTFGNRQNHQPKSVRKLLLHKTEIRRLAAGSQGKGHAIVPLSFYWKNSKVKVQLALCKGKVEYDKRQDVKDRDSKRELQRATMHRLT
jgi:SsrA-binding protein